MIAIICVYVIGLVVGLLYARKEQDAIYFWMSFSGFGLIIVISFMIMDVREYIGAHKCINEMMKKLNNFILGNK